MEGFLYILLGAFLAVGGGFLTQRNQKILDRIDEDHKLILEANRVLSSFDLMQDQLSEIQDTQDTEKLLKRNKLNYQCGKLMEDLVNIAIRIRSKEYLKLSSELTKFALHDNLRTSIRLEELIRVTYVSINKEMIELYENDIESIDV